MFSFEPLDRCLYNEIESGDISEYVEQRFVLHFGDECLDNKFLVFLGTEYIRFFYYDCEQSHPRNVLNVDYLKELGCISLTNPKDTGNDILSFPQMTCDTNNKPQIKDDEDSIIKALEKQFYNFPLWKEENKNDENNIPFRNLVRCCLLIFVFEVEDRNEIFSVSPLYDHVRNMLRKSDVYKLLSTKIQYTLYIPQDGFVYNSEEYSYKTRKFAEGLMNGRLNKVIAPHDYPSNEGNKQWWFNNPEEELEKILDQNRKQQKLKKDALEVSLVLKIRDFLYTKHAVGQAMTKKKSKYLFRCGQFLMCLTNLIVISSLISAQVFNVFHFPFLFYALCVLCVLIFLSIFLSGCYNFCSQFVSILQIFLSIVLLGCYNKTRTSTLLNSIAYAFFPRILVAELVAWLTIGIVEDLVKSMLWVHDMVIVLIAIILVLLIILSIIGGEIKQHSPYISNGEILKRSSLIINHALFFCFFIGFIIQTLFYNNLIKASDVLSSVVFNNYFDDANYYCQNLTDMDNSINQYNEFFYTINSKEKSLLRKMDKKNSSVVDSIEFKDYNEYHKSLVCRIQTISKELGLKDSLSIPISMMSDSMEIDSMKRNMKSLLPITTFLQEEIMSVRRNSMKFNDYATLMNWTIADSTYLVNTGSDYLDSITMETQKYHKCSRIIFKYDDKFHLLIFPYLLISHTLIVLVLSFITQLIISEKTVTEPL